MANVQYYDVILKPVITEKSMNAMGDKKYTFFVHPEATKTQIKEAVKSKKRKYHEHRRQEEKTWYDSRKNS